METPNQRELIIGIDFGSTYTGIGWSVLENEHIFTVQEWPTRGESEGSMISPKVPTRLRYLDGGEFEWGYQIPNDALPWEIMSLFKRGLEPGSLVFRDVDQNITDYLSRIFASFIKAVPIHIGIDIYSGRAVCFALTVPTIWSEQRKQRIIQAFERIPNLPRGHSTTLLSESEAAATAALRDLAQNDLGVNDSFVLVDAGGDTVDLITYTITSLTPTLEIAETTEGTSDFCGSSRLNDRFINFLASGFHNEEHWDDHVLREAVECFDKKIKRMFDMSSLALNREYIVPVRGLNVNPGLGVHNPGRLSLMADQIHLIFEPDIIRIIQLVKDQIAMAAVPIKKIILVGGYGSSMYLRERLQIAIREDSSITNDIEILQPPNGWVSVVRGAIMKEISLAKSSSSDIETYPVESF
ncbi:uncharacterized protein GGS22DRAFT_186710 [Annulohypoxylon maeteangense]|uniref:uncharacterized protein n=1 Tax=Annulohypoxylon maeteangense TaxID=1927788 RepID=UPI002008B449|nr:uncharacterized protein GGS22DRAFT_186710 [Annulohypoxylon maeteangense]KAI0886640.1 hypothetical protein GGS22DRAFT_186710 [Annulohypoxylon maeteangense]